MTLGFRLFNLIHPTVQISRTVTMGEGVIISSGVHIAAYTSIGNHVVLDRACIISHKVKHKVIIHLFLPVPIFPVMLLLNKVHLLG